MSQRPRTGMRVGSSYGRQRTALKTGQRMGTGFMTGRMGTARMNMGTGILNSQVNVGERVMQDHGLGGSRPKTQGPGRQVMDETFFLGALRSKSAEIGQEIEKLRKELAKHERDHSTYSTYEKKAEGLAAELQVLNGELADWNMLAQNLNENIEITEVQADMEEMKARNDREENEVDNIFSDRTNVESQIKEVEAEIEAEKRATENLVNELSNEDHVRYRGLEAEATQLQQTIEQQQQQLDALTHKASMLQRELDNNPIKKEAAALMDQIAAMKAKQAKLRAEMEKEAMLSPEMLKEKLLEQVRTDNQEISAMERKIVEVQAKINELSSDIADMDNDNEEVDDEKRQKYLQLLQHEKEMDAFLLSFDANCDLAREQITELSEQVETLLQAITTHIESQQSLPSQDAAATLKSDLDFKTDELAKSEQTAKSLETKRQSLARDLKNVEQLEDKIEQETNQLQEQLRDMRESLERYKDIDGLVEKIDKEKQTLQKEQQRLSTRKGVMSKVVSDLASRHEKQTNKLKAHETHNQIVTLEKKWQHYEKNNFVVRDIVLAKEKEADFSAISSTVQTMVGDYNDFLQKQH